MNLKEIKEMISLMNENGLIELEIEKDDMRIRLKKAGSGSITEVFNGHQAAERGQIGSGTASAKELPDAIEKMAVKTVEIKAPMVGTFYRAPSPEAVPYVETGQVIEAGQVICIIEAMKLMNEIKGRVLEILVDNAEPVEFGQPMFLIEPL